MLPLVGWLYDLLVFLAAVLIDFFSFDFVFGL